ncbi:MAG: hypothetical protein EXS37_21590 [Opitutus sp.]|nr:hypothetical protein [Opitutus sp.]
MLVLAGAGVLFGYIVWRFGYSASLVGYVMLGGVGWFLFGEWRSYRRQEAAAAACIRQLGLERDPTAEVNRGEFLSDGEIWWCYRGLFEDAPRPEV